MLACRSAALGSTAAALREGRRGKTWQRADPSRRRARLYLSLLASISSSTSGLLGAAIAGAGADVGMSRIPAEEETTATLLPLLLLLIVRVDSGLQQ